MSQTTSNVYNGLGVDAVPIAGRSIRRAIFRDGGPHGRVETPAEFLRNVDVVLRVSRTPTLYYVRAIRVIVFSRGGEAQADFDRKESCYFMESNTS